MFQYSDIGLIKYVLEVTCIQEIEKTLHVFVIEVIGRIKANYCSGLPTGILW